VLGAKCTGNGCGACARGGATPFAAPAGALYISLTHHVSQLSKRAGGAPSHSPYSYLAIVGADGGGVTSETISISAHEMSVIGTTGSRPHQASAPETCDV